MDGDPVRYAYGLPRTRRSILPVVGQTVILVAPVAVCVPFMADVPGWPGRVATLALRFGVLAVGGVLFGLWLAREVQRVEVTGRSLRWYTTSGGGELPLSELHRVDTAVIGPRRAGARPVLTFHFQHRRVVIRGPLRHGEGTPQGLIEQIRAAAPHVAIRQRRGARERG
jgi:hypothetical protein